MIHLLSACNDYGSLAEVEVQAAQLSAVELGTVALLVGAVNGRAILEITRIDGGTQSHAVTLEGNVLGLVVEIDSVIDFDAPTELDISQVDGIPTGGDLLGVYRGISYGAAIGIGVNTHALENASEVEIDRSYFAAGLAVFAGMEWMDIEPEGAGADAPDSDEVD